MLANSKSRSEAQELIFVLSTLQKKTPAQEKQLAVLLKAAESVDKAKRMQKKAESVLNNGLDEERKARTHGLIKRGLLLDFAGAGEEEDYFVVAALLALKAQPAEVKQPWLYKAKALLEARK